ncbi:MAG TPA: Hsp20/alpha crystallin family protein [Planctomycetota bacterium]|nr:Hsp20/alpha crystallin family protein [Planctomycetota bacterium]
MTHAITKADEQMSMAPCARKTFMPLANVYETPEAYIVIADMPGVDEKSVDISLKQNLLTIRSSMKPLEMEGFELVHCEYENGDYERTFTLPDVVDANGIEATVKNGVLRVTLPKAEAARPRKIAVKSE